MSNDPFDALEQRLRGAVARSTRRRFALSRRGGVALAFVVLAGGGVAGAAGVLSSSSDSATEQAIAAGYRAAYSTPACQVDRRPRRAATTAGSADPRVQRDFEIFGRPTRPNDRSVPLRYVSAGGGTRILRDAVRVARATDGAKAYLAISVGATGFPARRADPVACATVARNAALRHVDPADTATRRRVARIMSGRVAAVRINSAPTTERLAMLFRAPPGGRGGGGGATIIRRGRVPAISSWGTVRDPHGHARTRTNGLVPDRVVAVRFVDKGGPAAARSPTTSVAVRDNVYDVLLPRHMGPTVLVQWLSKNGSVVRTSHLYGI